MTVKLPPMPEPAMNDDGTQGDGLTVEQARAYAIQAVLEERERNARLCETLVIPQDAEPYAKAIHGIAAAIRASRSR